MIVSVMTHSISFLFSFFYYFAGEQFYERLQLFAEERIRRRMALEEDIKLKEKEESEAKMFATTQAAIAEGSIVFLIFWKRIKGITSCQMTDNKI